MSTAYFVVLDNKDVDFDCFVNGKFIAQEAKKKLTRYGTILA